MLLLVLCLNLFQLRRGPPPPPFRELHQLAVTNAEPLLLTHSISPFTELSEPSSPSLPS